MKKVLAAIAGAIAALFATQNRQKRGKPTRISDLSLIKRFEGLRLKAYKPTKRDVWTIGWGHTETAQPGMEITKRKAEKLLRQDLKWVRRAIKELVDVPLSQPQYDALASFIFNVGRTNFASSTLLEKLNAGDYHGAANEFRKWKYQDGVVLKGLVRRREEERNLFLKGTQ